MKQAFFSFLKRFGGSVGASLLTVALVAGGSATAAMMITGSQIKNGTLTLKDFKPSERAKLIGPGGPQGEQGPTGPVGPLGPAGGDLSGTFPNPEIAAGAVGSPEVADGSLTSADIGSVGQSDLGGTVTENLDFGLVAAHACSVFAVASPGSVGDIAFVVPDGGSLGDSSSPLTVEVGKVTSPGFASVHICNVNIADFNPPAQGFRIFTIRP